MSAYVGAEPMRMEADVKLGAKVVLIALTAMLLLRMLGGAARSEGGFGQRMPRLSDASDLMLRLDAARRPPLPADG